MAAKFTTRGGKPHRILTRGHQVYELLWKCMRIYSVDGRMINYCETVGEVFEENSF